MKNTTLLILLSFFIISCGDKTRTSSSNSSSSSSSDKSKYESKIKQLEEQNNTLKQDRLKQDRQDREDNISKQSSYIEKKKDTYYHSCVSGCVIVNQDGTKKVKWKKKCGHCGRPENMTRNDYRSGGTSTSVYFCHKCKGKTDVRIKTTRNRN